MAGAIVPRIEARAREKDSRYLSVPSQKSAASLHSLRASASSHGHTNTDSLNALVGFASVQTLIRSKRSREPNSLGPHTPLKAPSRSLLP